MGKDAKCFWGKVKACRQAKKAEKKEEKTDKEELIELEAEEPKKACPCMAKAKKWCAKSKDMKKCMAMTMKWCQGKAMCVKKVAAGCKAKKVPEDKCKMAVKKICFSKAHKKPCPCKKMAMKKCGKDKQCWAKTMAWVKKSAMACKAKGKENPKAGKMCWAGLMKKCSAGMKEEEELFLF